MNKKQKMYLSWGVPIFAAVCGVVAFFMIFMEAVRFESFFWGTSFKGLQVALGYTDSGQPVFHASAGIILAFLLPLIGSCVAIIGKGNKVVSALASAMMLTGGILAFFTVSLLKCRWTGSIHLAAGPIVSGVFAIVGAVAEGGSIFLKA